MLPIDGPWLQPPYITTPQTHSSPDRELLSFITPLLKSAGMTQLKCRYPTVRYYYEVSTRQALIAEIINQLSDYQNQMGDSLVGDSLNNFITQCEQLQYHVDLAADVSSQLDILHTIDQPPVTTDSFFEKYGKPVGTIWNRYLLEWPAKRLRELFDCQKPVPFQDEAALLMRKMGIASRKRMMEQRVVNAILTAHDKGWYIIFDTLTLAPDRIEQFYQDNNALRNHFRNVGRDILRAENRRITENPSDCYQYFCVPEYGSKEGRLHFHVVYLLRTLPKGSRDPNEGYRPRTRRVLDSMHAAWPYGFNSPIAVRYTGDAFSIRNKWLWPIDKNGKPLDSKPAIAVARYVTKYVGKQVEQNSIKNNVSGEKWNQQLSQILKTIPKSAFRVRSSRGFGLTVAPMDKLPQSVLLELTRLHSTVSRRNALLKRNAQKILTSRLGALTSADILASQPAPTNLLKSLRHLMLHTQEFNLQSFIDLMTPKLRNMDISDETRAYLSTNGYLETEAIRPRAAFGCK